MKQVQFKTKAEADTFKAYLNLKAVSYAYNSDSTLVIIRSPITDQEFYELLIRYGRWL